MPEIRVSYNPMEHAAAAFIAAAGEVDALRPRVDSPAGVNSGNANVNDGIAHIARHLRGDLAKAATALHETGRLLHGAHLAYDATDRSVMLDDPTSAGPS